MHAWCDKDVSNTQYTVCRWFCERMQRSWLKLSCGWGPFLMTAMAVSPQAACVALAGKGWCLQLKQCCHLADARHSSVCSAIATPIAIVQAFLVYVIKYQMHSPVPLLTVARLGKREVDIHTWLTCHSRSCRIQTSAVYIDSVPDYIA